MPSPRNRYTLVRRISVLQGNEFAEVVGGGGCICVIRTTALPATVCFNDFEETAVATP